VALGYNLVWRAPLGIGQSCKLITWSQPFLMILIPSLASLKSANIIRELLDEQDGNCRLASLDGMH
jgi:hypothetical protein